MQTVKIKAEDSYNNLVKVCVAYLNTLEGGSAEQEAMTMYVNVHMTAIRQALEYLVEMDESPTEEGKQNEADE